MLPASRRSTQAHPDTVAAGLNRVRRQVPAIDRTLAERGAWTLASYVPTLLDVAPASLQSPSDFVTSFCNCAESLLGAPLADRLADQLRREPVVLTTNHHGLDTFAQSLQTNLLFTLRAGAAAPGVIPVLACGNVPMNNLTYPRGLLAYATSRSASVDGALKMPLFPDRTKRTMVSAAPPFDAQMLARLRKRLARSATDGVLPKQVVIALQRMIDEDFSDVLARGCESYSDQATLLNLRLWRRLFSDAVDCPELVYVELERVSRDLLIKDLENDGSLVAMLLFDDKVRQALLLGLNGERGCWSLRKLGQHRSRYDQEVGGTAFFWGLDQSGRRVALLPVPARDGSWRLEGTDDSGEAWSIPLNGPDLVAALLDGRILPSVFTSFAVTGLARGVTCVGGYYQAGYFPRMQTEVVAALRASDSPAVRASAEMVSAAVTDKYLSGMQAIVAQYDGQLVPAGIGEIAAAGGLDQAHLAAIRQVSVEEAHLASLADTLADVSAPASGGVESIAALNLALVGLPLGVPRLAVRD